MCRFRSSGARPSPSSASSVPANRYRRCRSLAFSTIPPPATLRGEILFGGRDLLKASKAELREVRGNEITMVFQEPMTSLNPLHTVERQIGEILALHKGIEGKGARAHLGASRGGRHPQSREPARGLPASAFGRAAPARDDRHGARQRAEAPDRRRTDDRARRDRAGANSRAPQGAAGKARHGDAVHHARPQHRAAHRGPGLRHATWPHRRGGRYGRDLRPAAARLYPHAPCRRSRKGAPDRSPRTRRS